MARTYLVEIEGAERLVTVDDGPDGLRVRIGDEPEQAANWSLAQDPAIYSLLLDGQSRQVRVVPDPEQANTWQLSLRGHRFSAHVQTERERRLSRVSAGKQAPTGPLTIKAPMPGLVRAVVVQVGDTVQQGQRLLLLEAMKMENEIPAPRAGTVQAIQVAAGETVDTGRP